jgi:hypothetical protein
MAGLSRKEKHLLLSMEEVVQNDIAPKVSIM